MFSNMTKVKRRTISMTIIFVLILAMAGIGGYLYFNGLFEEKYTEAVSETKAKLAEQERVAYVALTDLKAGDVITEENTAKTMVFSSMGSELFAQGGELGKPILVDVAEGTQILKAMVADEQYEDDVRQVEYTSVELSGNIGLNDYIDVRILYPDGTDYGVFAKKAVGFSEVGELVLNVTEEEILLMDSAMVDAMLYSGSKLYATKYVQPTIQSALVVDYTPSAQVIDLIKFDPNIISIANQYLTYQTRADREAGLVNYETIKNEIEEREGYVSADDYIGTYYQHLQTQPEIDDTADVSDGQ